MKNHRLVFRKTDRDKFEEIDKGLKTIETRAATVKYKSIQAGDQLTFACSDHEITRNVASVIKFNSLDEMFDKLPLDSILPSVKNINEAKEIYYSFPNYREKIEKEGILAFTLK